MLSNIVTVFPVPNYMIATCVRFIHALFIFKMRTLIRFIRILDILLSCALFRFVFFTVILRKMLIEFQNNLFNTIMRYKYAQIYFMPNLLSTTHTVATP